MKPGDKVKVTNYRDDSHQIMTVIEVLDKGVKLKHPVIGGYFIIAKFHVHELNSDQ
tara:strand:- start:140 stop:307 length:168 start_codon:yes stop_codon:yes gene_type:complete